MRAEKLPDPVEEIVARALDMAAIAYTRPDPPDFLLTDSGIAIECKRMFTPRATAALQRHHEIILIQGLDAAKAFRAMVGYTARELRSSTEYILKLRHGED